MNKDYTTYANGSGYGMIKGKYIVTDIEFKGKDVMVSRNEEHTVYYVAVNGEDKHGSCTAEDVMRIMAFYMHDESISKEESK